MPLDAAERALLHAPLPTHIPFGSRRIAVSPAATSTSDRITTTTHAGKNSRDHGITARKIIVPSTSTLSTNGSAMRPNAVTCLPRRASQPSSTSETATTMNSQNASTIRDRRASRCAVFGRRAHCSNVRRSSSVNSNGL